MKKTQHSTALEPVFYSQHAVVAWLCLAPQTVAPKLHHTAPTTENLSVQISTFTPMPAPSTPKAPPSALLGRF